MENLDRHLATLIDSSTSNGKCTSLRPTPEIQTDGAYKGNNSMSEEDDLDVCSNCVGQVTDGIGCDSCNRWYHFQCENIDDDQTDFLRYNETNYSCLSCRHLTLFIHNDTINNSTISEPTDTNLTLNDSCTETLPKQFLYESILEVRADETNQKQILEDDTTEEKA